MSEAENLSGNGAASGAGDQAHDPRSLSDYGRQIQHDAAALAATVHDATGGAQRYLSEQVEQRPYRTLGVAAGIGYILGGGLSSRLTVVLLGAATRLAMALAARELGSRIAQSGSAPAHNKSF